ncbi:NmrA domain-containing protein [Fusarium keratoplasticum]|uniref:NmrA domain-containing protein n=1 Tax=Fusarium keratoplasticum TaxID=1328300 RepID=A0ACC0RAV8_9HYPO|nr:NmrA domain-containing protein [Fusarium keratoplasticum]KAI8683383.1 NmrA domain-containing protein [Fusarium keratoplasticum]
MASPFKNILIIGATGSIGSVVLEALVKEPTFVVTALQRSSSEGKLPSGLKTITIDDSYPSDALVGAFSGHDAIINCMTSLAVGEQLRFIDAAVTAKVRRYVSSEYGLNNNKPEARALNSVFREKGEIQDYLRSKESTGLEWMAIACGMWLKWSAQHDFLGMHIKEKKFVVWDDGEGWFSTTTEENTALALVNALAKKWDETKNQVVWLSDFAITQNMLLAAIERISGQEYTTEKIDTLRFIEEKQAAVASGDPYAVYALIETGFVTGKFGGHLEKEGPTMNELLGLPKKSLDEVVRAALKAVQGA